MKRLLFLSPGNNLGHLGPALDIVGREQGVEIAAENILAYQVSDGVVTTQEVVRAAERADVILFDIRDAGQTVAELRSIRERYPEKTFIALMGGALEVMSLTRMGPFTLDRVLAGRSRGGSFNYRRIQQITNLIDKLGGVLPVGSLKHARHWVHVVRYWTSGGRKNIENLLRLVVREYCGGRGPKPQPPIERPTHCLEHPAEGRSYSSIKAYLNAHPLDASLPTVAILYYGGMHHEESVVGLTALIEAFTGRADVLPIATDGIESLEPIRRFLLCDGAPKINALISLLWFRLNGGPLGGDQQETLDLLNQLDVPFMVPATLYARELEKWAQCPEGLSPVETYATVVLPELDGALAPIPIFGLVREEKDGFTTVRAQAVLDRVAVFAERLLAHIRLANTPREDRRVALIAYDYPPGPANAGNASYLDVAQSIRNIMDRLAAEGYDVGSTGKNPFKDIIEAGIHNGNRWQAWSGEYLDTGVYFRRYKELEPETRSRMEKVFGSPPGEVLVDDKGFRIPGRWFGNVFLGLQPSRQPFAESTETTHDKELPPHHQYLAFYQYLRERQVQACVHIGTHGTVEFTPGKEVGLSGTCFPDIMQGAIPQFYIYTIANPSEASIAKRRWQAALISHHTPDFVPAELYGEYQALLDDLERLQDAGFAKSGRKKLMDRIREQAQSLDLPHEDLDQLADELRGLRNASIPNGLYVFGTGKDGRSMQHYLTALFRRRIGGVCVSDLADETSAGQAGDQCLETWAREFITTGGLPPDLESRLDKTPAATLKQDLVTLSRNFLDNRELEVLCRGLDGRYIPPGLMGDCLRSPAVYPTGRNGTSFDPTRIPFPDALERGYQLGQALVERHRSESGQMPKMVGLVLWGFETARTGGETIGQLLYLVGARLKESPGWLPAFEPIPVSDLGHPRVDVYLMICGFFRDMFPTLVRDLDKLLREIAALGETVELNPLRAHTLRVTESVGEQLAGARIFGPRPGEYGTGMPSTVEASAWSSETELGNLYAAAMGHAYGAGLHGVAAHQAFGQLLERTETVSQVIDGEEYKIGDLDHYYEFLGGATRAVENRRGSKPQTMVGDSARNIPRMEAADKELERCSITRLLNPKWIEGMLAHELHGAKKIDDRITNLLGLAGTIGVPTSLFDKVFARYIEDEELFRRLRENNIHAAASIVNRMGEAHQREFWQATPEQLELLKQRYVNLEADLER